MKPLPSALLVITDRHQARLSIVTIAEAVGQAGGRWLMLRDKDLEPAQRRGLAGDTSALPVGAASDPEQEHALSHPERCNVRCRLSWP